MEDCYGKHGLMVLGGGGGGGTQHLSALRHSLQMAATSKRGKRPGACEKTQRLRRKDSLKDTNTDRQRDGDRLTECKTKR